MWEIYTYLSGFWWLNLGLFIVSILISWFLPGILILSHTKLPKLVQFYVAPILGMSIWALAGYVFGWLNIRWAMYVLVTLYLVWGTLKLKTLKNIDWKLSLGIPTWLVLLSGVILQMVPIWGSGWREVRGITFYFVNIFDGVFHLSLARSLVDHVPPFQPGAVGLPVTNYHYLSDLVFAELTRVWHLPLIHLYFQYVPLFLSIWLGFLIIVLLRQWSKSNLTVIFGLLLFYAVGELSWLINIVLGSNSQVPFQVFMDHGVIQFLNQPQAFAKAVFFAILILLHHYWKKKGILIAVLIGVMSATLLGFKVYFGLAAAAGFGLVGGFWSIQYLLKKLRHQLKRDTFQLDAVPFLIIVSIASILGAAIYLPANSGAGGLFFDFLSWPKLLIGAEKINWPEWWLRLQVYQAAGNLKALTVWYSLAATVFLIAIYHLRLIGVLSLFKKLRGSLLLPELIFLVGPAFIFLILGTNTLQTSGGANTFNFIVVSVAILNLLSAVVMGELSKSKLLSYVSFAVLSLTIVQTGFLEYFFIKNYISGGDSQSISKGEEEALAFLATKGKDTVVQTHPKNFLDRGTPYIYYFTGHPTYLGGVGILESHNQAISVRKDQMASILLKNPAGSAELAIQLGITDFVIDRSQGSEFEFFVDKFKFVHNQGDAYWEVEYFSKDMIILKPVQSSITL